MQMEERFIETNGVKLHVVLDGPQDGPPLILLHGFPEFWYGWHKQIPSLAAAGLRVIVPDQRGYNLSDKPPHIADYNLNNLAADVVGLAKTLGYEQFFLAGHDWGAAVAWWTATVYPQHVKKLAILNVPYPTAMARAVRKGNLRQLLKSWYIFAFQMPWFPEWSATRGHAAFMARMVRSSGLPTTFSDDDMKRYREAWTRPNAMRSMMHWYRAMFRHPPNAIGQAGDIARAKRKLPMPVLILWGERDQFLDKALIEPSLAHCADGRAITFPNATHWLQHDEAEAVSHHLIVFFAEP